MDEKKNIDEKKNRWSRYANIILGIVILCSALANIYSGLVYGSPFLFYLPMFFTPALIIAFVLIFKKTIGLGAAVILFILGAAYSLVPIFPGPPIWFSVFGNPEFLAQNVETILLLATVYSAKWLSLISSLYVLISAIVLRFKK